MQRAQEATGTSLAVRGTAGRPVPARPHPSAIPTKGPDTRDAILDSSTHTMENRTVAPLTLPKFLTHKISRYSKTVLF